jgi:hypothetical protein
VPVDPAYRPLFAALEASGVHTWFQGPQQLIISHQFPNWPTGGNSFWVTRHAGAWIVVTFAPQYYAAPAGCDIAALCFACLAASPERAMWELPADLIQRWGLREMSHAEAEVLDVNRDAQTGAE